MNTFPNVPSLNRAAARHVDRIAALARGVAPRLVWGSLLLRLRHFPLPPQADAASQSQLEDVYYF